MASEFYRDHTIVCSAVYDDVSGKWKMAAFVSWQESGSAKRTQIFRHSPELFSRFEDAEKAAMENAKNGIDGQLKEACNPATFTISTSR